MPSDMLVAPSVGGRTTSNPGGEAPGTRSCEENWFGRRDLDDQITVVQVTLDDAMALPVRLPGQPDVFICAAADLARKPDDADDCEESRDLKYLEQGREVSASTSTEGHRVCGTEQQKHREERRRDEPLCAAKFIGHVLTKHLLVRCGFGIRLYSRQG